jgi:hypothetical protein
MVVDRGWELFDTVGREKLAVNLILFTRCGLDYGWGLDRVLVPRWVR